MEALEKLGHMQHITRISGTSAGSQSAALIAAGYSAKELVRPLCMCVCARARDMHMLFYFIQVREVRHHSDSTIQACAN